MNGNLIKPVRGRESITVVPDSAGWKSLEYRVLSLQPGECHDFELRGQESAIVTISGAGQARAGDSVFALRRKDVFDEMASLLYVPPRTPVRLTAGQDGQWVLAIGTAPATGRHPVRLIDPSEVVVEVRGGGPARRQVNHLLAPPLPAERLIVYEVLVPGGSWAGWPPHRHDGEQGSPYLEETYHFKFDRPDGFGFHRTYANDGSDDETFTVKDGDCVIVPRGFHVTTAAPGHNMWILNFLAGDLIDDDRASPPYFDPASTWILDDWSAGQVRLPVAYEAQAGGRR
jgi:5-deoxy-glucuronate isomerase